MSIDARELRRLYEAAIASLAQDFGQAETFEEKHLAAYLCAYIPDILSALDDRERLDSGRIRLAGHLYLEQDLRAAIDAARGAK